MLRRTLRTVLSDHTVAVTIISSLDSSSMLPKRTKMIILTFMHGYMEAIYPLPNDRLVYHSVLVVKSWDVLGFRFFIIEGFLKCGEFEHHLGMIDDYDVPFCSSRSKISNPFPVGPEARHIASRVTLSGNCP